MASARALNTRYSKSSQTDDRLIKLCTTLELDELRAIRDVETRLWSTFVTMFRLLYLNAVKLNEQLSIIVALLSATDLTIVRLLKLVVEPFANV